MQINIHDAKTNLSKLIEAARNGEEVIIARNGKPMVRLVAMTKSGFRFGGLEQLKGTVPDFLEPMPEDELRLWEGRGDDPA
jgi:prevent-host-death family protein